MEKNTCEYPCRNESAFTPLPRLMQNALHLSVDDVSRYAGDREEFSAAFEAMGKTVTRLERQNQELTNLVESLQLELEAKTAIENDLRREQTRLQKLAATDPLTGIANRRYFFQAAARELERIRRTKTPACLAMLDIDHFKALNDSLGHSAGDKALKRVAKIITESIRPYDIVGRYGGDEFIFLFPEISRDQAHVLLERLRDAIEQAKIAAGEGSLYITVSIGLIALEIAKKTTANTLTRLINRADSTLYEAKISRNHICIL